MKISSVILLLCLIMFTVSGQQPVQIGIAGLSHSHVLPLLRNLDRSDITIVDVAKSDTALSNQNAKQFGIDKKFIFNSLDEMLEKIIPEVLLVLHGTSGVNEDSIS